MADKIGSLFGFSKPKTQGPSKSLLRSQENQERRLAEKERKERRELQARERVQAGLNLRGGPQTAFAGFGGLSETLGG